MNSENQRTAGEKRQDVLNRIQTRKLTLGNSLLLAFAFTLVFIIPIFPMTWHKILYNVTFMIIFFMAVLSLKNQKHMFKVAVIIAAVGLASTIFDLSYLFFASRLFNFVFFIFIVSRLIVQIAQTKIVTANVILEAINGYLLLGVVFSIIVSFIVNFYPTVFNFSPTHPQVVNFSQHVYFSFVTLATLGYGDIVPKTPLGQSLAILTAVSGHLYVAVLIAMLVGKFSSQSK